MNSKPLNVVLGSGPVGLAVMDELVARGGRVIVAGRLMLRLLGLFNPMIREIVEMYYEFDQAFVVDHSQFARRFGTRTTPHAAAIRETVAWYRAHADAAL